MDELLRAWRQVYDEREAATAWHSQQIEQLQKERAEIAVSFDAQLAAWEDQIKAEALAIGKSHKIPEIGVAVNFRKGYERISYDAKKTDAVLGVLRDILPETATTLGEARKVSTVAASVSVQAM